MKKKLILPVVFLAAACVASFGEIIFQEDFDFPAGIEVLGNENGWQSDFNDEGPSVAGLKPRHTQEASPFAPAGLALQPGNSKERTHRKIEAYTGQTIFFSFSMKSFNTDGQAVLRFRSEDGLPLWVGQMDGQFGIQTAADAVVAGQAMVEKKSYFVAGRLETSTDGRSVTLEANIYEAAGDVPMDEPAEWQVSTSKVLGEPKVWNGVEFLVASSNAAFDGLRIGTTWADVTLP